MHALSRTYSNRVFDDGLEYTLTGIGRVSHHILGLAIGTYTVAYLHYYRECRVVTNYSATVVSNRNPTNSSRATPKSPTPPPHPAFVVIFFFGIHCFPEFKYSLLIPLLGIAKVCTLVATANMVSGLKLWYQAPG